MDLMFGKLGKNQGIVNLFKFLPLVVVLAVEEVEVQILPLPLVVLAVVPTLTS